MSYLIAKIKEAREKRGTVIIQAGKILEKASAEKRALTPEENAEVDKRHEDADRMLKEIEAMERQLELERNLTNAPQVQETETPKIFEPSKPANVVEQQRQEYLNFIRRGWDGLTPEQRKAHEKRALDAPLTTTTGSSGAYVIPDAPFQAFTDALLKRGGFIGGGAEVIYTEDGRELAFPGANDTSNIGALLTEGSAESNDNIMTFTTTKLNAWQFTSTWVLAPIGLLQDAYMNIEQYLNDKLTERLFNVLEHYAISGNNSDQPNGLANCATAGATAKDDTTLCFEDFIDLEHSVDPEYRLKPTCKWMFNDATLKLAKKIVDGDDRYIFVPGMAVNAPDRILGYPYVINTKVAAPTAGNKAIYFGDLSAYKFRIVRGVSLIRAVEKYAEYLQVGFLAYLRADSDLVDAGTHPIKYLAMAAS